MTRFTVWRVALAALAVLSACKAKGGNPGGGAGAPGTTRMGVAQAAPRVPSLGEQRVTGFASDLRVSPDGQTAVALVDAQTPALPGVPPNLKLGALWAVPVDGQGSQKVANGVSTMPGGVLFSPDGRFLLALGAWDVAHQRGDLYVYDARSPSAERTRVAADVTYVLPSPDSKSVALVVDGLLQYGPLPSGPFRQLAGEVATAEFAPNGAHVYFRRKVAAGGGLYQVDLRSDKGAPKRMVDQVGDFAISQDSKYVVALARTNAKQFGFELFVADAATLTAHKVADDVTRFGLSGDSKVLAHLQITTTLSKTKGGGVNPQDLQMGELIVESLATSATAQAGSDSRKVGARVREFEFTADSSRLIFRDRYEELPLVAEGKVEKVGDLTVVPMPDGAPKVVQKRCPNYVVSPDGRSLAFTVRIERPEYSRHLFIAQDGAEPVKVAEWLYEYAFTPDSQSLVFRTNCTRSGRSCDLRTQNVAKIATEKPKVEAEATYNFKLSDDGKRVVYTYAHVTDESYDVSALNWVSHERKTIDQFVKVPVFFGGAKGDKLVYLVEEKKRPGVYVSSSLP